MLRRIHPLILFAAVTLLACWKVVFHGEYTLLAGSDMARAYFPYFDVAAYWFKKGVFLLWDPYVYAGKPNMGEPQPGLFYPLNWLVMALPAAHGGVNLDGLQGLLIVDYFLAACFTWLLARSLGLEPPGAVLAGIAFAFGGYTVQVYGYVNKLSGFVWLPLVFCLFRRALDAAAPAARRRALIGAGLALGLAFLPGHHIPPVHAALLVGFYGAYRAAARTLPNRERLRVLLALGAVAGVAAALTAVQWLPSAEWARKVYRWIGEGPPMVWGQRVPYSSLAGSGGLSPQDALSLVLPYVSTGSNLYVGAPLLVLAAAGLLFGRGEARFFGLASVVYFLVSWGGLSALHGWANTFLPGVWFAREVFHYLIPFQLCVALLAGFGLEALVAGFRTAPPGPMREFVRRAGWGMAAAVPLLLGLAAAVHLVRDVPLDHPYLTGLGALAAYTALLGILFFLVYTRRLEPAAFGLLAVGLVMVDLSSEFARRVPPRKRPAGEENTYVREFWRRPAAIDFLLAERRREPFRIDDPDNLLPAEFGDVWRLESTMGHGATALVDYFALRGSGWGPSANASALLNVRYFASRAAIPGTEPVFGGDLPIYRNPRALPRAFLASGYRVIAGETDLLRWIASPLFAPRATVVLRPRERAALGAALPAALDEEDGLNLRVVSVRTAADKRAMSLTDPDLRQRLLRSQPPWGWSVGDDVRVALRPASAVEHCFVELEYVPVSGAASCLQLDLERAGARRAVAVELPGVPPGGTPPGPARWVVDIGPLEAGETLLGLERTALCTANLERIRIRRNPVADRGDPGTAALEVFEPNRLAVRVAARRPALLVLSEVYYPGWQARLDGRPVPLGSGDYVLRVAPVPAGEHTLELRFRSRTFLLGLGVSLVSLGAVILALRGAGRR